MRVSFGGMSKRFGATPALARVSASLEGKVCMLLGPNGSGKTTLISCLAGLTYPDEGWLEVEGKRYDASRRGEWRAGTRRVMAGSGLVGDKLGLPGTFTVRDFFAWSAGSRGSRLDRSEAATLSSRLGMDSYLDKKIGDCSSGMMQKVAVAASLLGRPKLVFWDEPTSNMDANGRRQLAGIASELVEQGTTLVVASHVPTEFEDLVDWIGVMANGRFLRTGMLSSLAVASDEFEASTGEPRALASRVLETGVGVSAELVGDRVRFTATDSQGGALSSSEALGRATGVRVSGLRRIPLSADRLYADLLRREEPHG